MTRWRLPEPKSAGQKSRAKPRVDYAELFAFQCKAAGIVEPAREFVFSPERKWRFDFAWVGFGVAVEIEGLVVRKVNGVMQVSGRHASITGMREDMVKYNNAALFGWMVLRFDQSLVKSGEALAMTERVLSSRLSAGSRPTGALDEQGNLEADTGPRMVRGQQRRARALAGSRGAL
jgi:hypothetical protein